MIRPIYNKILFIKSSLTGICLLFPGTVFKIIVNSLIMKKLSFMRRTLLHFFFFFTLLTSRAQENFPVNGVADPRPSSYAFTNATIFIDYQTKIDNATLLVNDGLIIAVGTNLQIPKDATTFDLKGKYIYPGFIDIYTNFGMPEVKSGQSSFAGSTQYESNLTGPYGWNEAIKSEFNALEEVSFDAPDLAGQTIKITRKYVDEKLNDIVEDRDLSRFIL